MRVWPTENLIYGELRKLPWVRYLAAMWIICWEVSTLYRERLSESERALMSLTLDAVEQVVFAGGRTMETDDVAAGLVANWKEFEQAHSEEVLPGQWNLWITFQDLAAELSGGAARYAASERVMLASTEIWREPYPGRARRIREDEEIDDNSPMAQTLFLLERIVRYLQNAEVRGNLQNLRSEIRSI